MKANKSAKTLYLITDQFVGTKGLTECFSELILESFAKSTWTPKIKQGIMNSTTVKSDSCCSSFGR